MGDDLRSRADPLFGTSIVKPLGYNAHLGYSALVVDLFRNLVEGLRDGARGS